MHYVHTPVLTVVFFFAITTLQLQFLCFHEKRDLGILLYYRCKLLQIVIAENIATIRTKICTLQVCNCKPLCNSALALFFMILNIRNIYDSPRPGLYEE